LGIRVLAVEYPQRIGFQSALAVLVELVEAGPQIGHQLLAVACTILAGAQTVQLQSHRLGQAQTLPQTPAEHDELGVDVRAGQVEGFHPDLVELAVTPLLRTLMAEHRSGVPDLVADATAEQAVL